MTKQQAIELGRAGGEQDVIEVFYVQGIEALRVEWDEGAINAGAAEIVGVPPELRADYYKAYRDAAHDLATKLLDNHA